VSMFFSGWFDHASQAGINHWHMKIVLGLTEGYPKSIYWLLEQAFSFRNTPKFRGMYAA
jgi:hypothetical protein